jgi:hypothetical protein
VSLFRRYWQALVLIILILAAFDVEMSSLATCHPPSERGAATVKGEDSDHCNYTSGPLAQSFRWFVDEIDEHDGFFVVLFTAVLAAFTAALWRSTDKLWEAGERQLKTARSSAAVQARNTRRQLKLAEETAERQLRAYVSIKELIPQVIVYPDGITREGYMLLEVKPVWKNGGQTPALNATNHISWVVLKGGFRDQIDFIDLDDSGKPDMGGEMTYPVPAIGPGEEVQAKQLLIWRHEIEKTGYGSGHSIFIWGWIEYNDVFQHTPRRRSEFCFKLQIYGNAKVSGDVKAKKVFFTRYGTRNRIE